MSSRSIRGENQPVKWLRRVPGIFFRRPKLREKVIDGPTRRAVHCNFSFFYTNPAFYRFFLYSKPAMHLRNVEIFCDVVKHGSFSKAAGAHQVSQSSASQAVHMLERRLGCRLIDRSKRPFELTPAGQIYYDGCRKILESFRHVEDRVQQMRNKVIGRVRLAAIYSVGLLQMDAYAKRYKTIYPDVVLATRLSASRRCLYADSQRRMPIWESFPSPASGVRSRRFPGKTRRWSSSCRPATGTRARARFGLSRSRFEALDGETFVGFTSELTIRKQIDRWFKQAGISVDLSPRLR